MRFRSIPEQLAAELADPVELRAERALSWNRFAGELVSRGSEVAWRALASRSMRWSWRARSNRHGVDCVVIGGVAMQVHGHVRTTRDLDTVVAWTPENMRALAGALAELDARLRGVDAELLGIDLTDPSGTV